MAVTHVTDHADQGVALLLDQYKEKPRIEALLRSYLDEVQELEDVIADIRASRDVDTTTGVHLEKIGRKVGQPRVGVDDLYRVFIRVRIRVNASHGKAKDVIAVAKLATLGRACKFYPLYPASFVIDVLEPLGATLTPLAGFIAGLIEEATAAGVGSSLHFSDSEEDETFAFSSDDDEQADAARGFADNAGLTGGQLIGAF